MEKDSALGAGQVSWLWLCAALALTQCLSAGQISGSNASGGSSSAGGGLPSNTGAASASATVGGGGTSAMAGGAGTLGGAARGASGNGAVVVAEPRGPSPAVPGVNFPFPQNRPSPFCNYPNYRNSDVTAAYARWKADTVTSDGANGQKRVQRPKDPGLEPNSTVSEGIGYGMLLAVYMNDQQLFDQLWKYEQMWVGKNGLMDWYISGNGVDRLGMGAASDADEDMAWALLMADRQWGGSGSLSDTYLNVAKHEIEQIFDNEIFEYKLLKPGDSWGDATTVNASYFAPAYYRVFAKVSGNDNWNQVLQTSYDTLAKALNATNGNLSNGLVPAWCTSDGVPNPQVFIAAPTNYQYDSCRTPFRIGFDYCLNGEPRAQSYVAKTSQFFSAIGAKKIVDGYNLDGSPNPQSSSGQSAAFVGPAVVGAMGNASYLGFVQDGYEDVASLNLLVGGDYYDESWTVLSLLMLSGNFLDYTTQAPAAAKN